MQTEWNFNYTGGSQYTRFKPGKYKLECWGACGGKKGVTAGNGGLGGYAKGELTLKKETILSVYVGEQGRDGSNAWTIFNGGGFGGVSTGGGATDIRLIAGDWDSQKGLLTRIIVAGGGGGHDSDTPTGGYSSAGGGTKGNNGTSTLSYHAPGATQYDGGRGADFHSDGSFGLGGGTITYSQYCKCGGGGGWFGGAGSKVSSSAGGGSGYVLTEDSYKPAGYTPTSEYYMINPNLATGNNTTKGHGYAKITLLQALPFLNVSSYNSTQATFKADHTDPTLLTKVEVFIDDVLKETVTTDLTSEKTINYTLEDNALHTLKIVVTDSNNATAEKVLSISKNIMPLPEDVDLNDISIKLTEVNTGFKVGKTSIINTLALKNIEASLNNTLVELSEKIKTSFDSSDASVEELQNKITELTNQLSQRKKWAKGTYTFTQNDYENFYINLESGIKTLEVRFNLDFIPRLIVVENFTLKNKTRSKYVRYPKIASDNIVGVVGRYFEGNYEYFGSSTLIKSYSNTSFVLSVAHTGRLSGENEYVCVVGESFTWYAYE